MRLLIALDYWLHKKMRGRCYNRWLCLKISYVDSRRVLKKAVRSEFEYR